MSIFKLLDQQIGYLDNGSNYKYSCYQLYQIDIDELCRTDNFYETSFLDSNESEYLNYRLFSQISDVTTEDEFDLAKQNGLLINLNGYHIPKDSNNVSFEKDKFKQIIPIYIRQFNVLFDNKRKWQPADAWQPQAIGYCNDNQEFILFNSDKDATISSFRESISKYNIYYQYSSNPLSTAYKINSYSEWKDVCSNYGRSIYYQDDNGNKYSLYVDYRYYQLRFIQSKYNCRSYIKPMLNIGSQVELDDYLTNNCTFYKYDKSYRTSDIKLFEMITDSNGKCTGFTSRSYLKKGATYNDNIIYCQNGGHFVTVCDYNQELDQYYLGWLYKSGFDFSKIKIKTMRFNAYDIPTRSNFTIDSSKFKESFSIPICPLLEVEFISTKNMLYQIRDTTQIYYSQLLSSQNPLIFNASSEAFNVVKQNFSQGASFTIVAVAKTLNRFEINSVGNYLCVSTNDITCQKNTTTDSWEKSIFNTWINTIDPNTKLKDEIFNEELEKRISVKKYYFTNSSRLLGVKTMQNFYNTSQIYQIVTNDPWASPPKNYSISPVQRTFTSYLQIGYYYNNNLYPDSLHKKGQELVLQNNTTCYDPSLNLFFLFVDFEFYLISGWRTKHVDEDPMKYSVDDKTLSYNNSEIYRCYNTDQPSTPSFDVLYRKKGTNGAKIYDGNDFVDTKRSYPIIFLQKNKVYRLSEEDDIDAGSIEDLSTKELCLPFNLFIWQGHYESLYWRKKDQQAVEEVKNSQLLPPHIYQGYLANDCFYYDTSKTAEISKKNDELYFDFTTRKIYTYEQQKLKEITEFYFPLDWKENSVDHYCIIDGEQVNR